MKGNILILFFILSSSLYGQECSNLYLDFESYAFGSNMGQVEKIYYVSNKSLHASFYSQYTKDELDTIYSTDYEYQDSIWRKDTLVVELRQTSIDSISRLIQFSNDTIIETNPCIRSGALYTLIVNCDGRHKVFTLYNSFDSTAFEITNIIQSYFPKNALDPRPIDSWITAQNCWVNLRRRKKEYEAEE